MLKIDGQVNEISKKNPQVKFFLKDYKINLFHKSNYFLLLVIFIVGWMLYKITFFAGSMMYVAMTYIIVCRSNDVCGMMVIVYRSNVHDNNDFCNNGIVMMIQ